MSPLLITGLVGLTAMSALWLASLALRDASIVDVWWGPGFGLLAVTAFVLAPQEPAPRAWLALGLTGLWGLRLGGYLLWRNWGSAEDPRYTAMRRHFGPERFPWISLFTVFGLQGLLQWTVSLPVQVTLLRGGGGPGWNALDALGVALFAVGLAFETVGDAQLARFRSDPTNRARVMDRGLWRYTRHPNYFGDFCVWWGLGALALAGTGAVWTLIGPALMSFLLLRVSGVALLERSIGRRRPAYADYADRTSAFFPRPPRRAS